MPKSKPTQVIVHRIELQDTERELAERLVNAKTFEAASKGAANVGIVMIGGVAVYVTWWTLEKVYNWMGDFVNPSWVDPTFPIWSDENRANFREAKPTLLEQALAGPSILWAIARQPN